MAKGEPIITCRVGHGFKHLPYTRSATQSPGDFPHANANLTLSSTHHDDFSSLSNGDNVSSSSLNLPSPKVRLDRGVKRVKDAITLGDVQEHANTGLLVSYVVDDYDIYSFDQALDVKCFTRRRRM